MEVTDWDKKKTFFRKRFLHKSLDRDISPKVSFADKAGIPNYTRCRSDNLSGQKNLFQPECLDLLPVFRSLCKVHLEQQKYIVSHYHQLKDRFVGSK
jgi:hypothetical protein